ncbi:hypothetical protein V6B14_00660 [Sporosarcina psychrophila]|uniref:hypothetical protein n=1 Tax=Sporosarcina psychrophila TaxID=1476 RepID=UPI0030D143F5
MLVTRSWKSFILIYKRETVIAVLLECVPVNTELRAEMSVWFACKAHVKHRTSLFAIIDGIAMHALLDSERLSSDRVIKTIH